MSTIVGKGQYSYEVMGEWGNLPDGWQLGDVGGVGIDSKDNVYVFNRSEHPMVVFDRDGNFLRSWGEGLFPHPHGVHMGPDDTIYCTDDGDQTVRKCTLDGKVLLTLGVPGKKAPFMSGQPFCRCTHTATSPSGKIYVSDGYGNAKVHTYSPDGKYLESWGEPGSGPGEFNNPHNIHCDADGYVYVADRENHRVQVFDEKGRFQRQWNNLHRPSGMFMPAGKCPVCFLGEIGPYYNFNRNAPNLGPRISILSNEGELLARITTVPAAGEGPGQFISPHGIAVDSQGNIFVGEVSYTAWGNLYPDKPKPAKIRVLQKFRKVPQ
jgi:DNA-binding beta-propeller fold protein YncE